MHAGSLTQFLIEKYGMQKFELLWRKGIAEMSTILGKTSKELDKEYRSFLQQKYPNTPPLNWALLSDKGCG
jgi:hypothetical protein